MHQREQAEQEMIPAKHGAAVADCRRPFA